MLPDAKSLLLALLLIIVPFIIALLAFLIYLLGKKPAVIADEESQRRKMAEESAPLDSHGKPAKAKDEQKGNEAVKSAKEFIKSLSGDDETPEGKELAEYSIQEESLKVMSEVDRKTRELEDFIMVSPVVVTTTAEEKDEDETSRVAEPSKREEGEQCLFTPEQKTVLETFDRSLCMMDACINDENRASMCYKIYMMKLKRPDLEKALGEGDYAWVRDIFIQLKETMGQMQKRRAQQSA